MALVPQPAPSVAEDVSGGKHVTAWYHRAVGYLCGKDHLSLALAMAEEGLYVPPAEDEGDPQFSSMQDQGWLRVGVVGFGGMLTFYIAGSNINYRAMVVKKVAGDLFDGGAVGFHTRMEVIDEKLDTRHFGEVLDSL